ncbi:MAG: hypothetical protein HY286_00785 [Planctomycetes bacterium]|nr:hypothetical protein [Planctomycetota bacterium]
MSDTHGSHGQGAAATAPHDPHGHDSHSADAHGQDAHGQDAHGGGHAHDEAPHQTKVGPFEATPWGAIGIGIAVVAVVVLIGVMSKWNDTIRNNPNSKLGAPGQPAAIK